MPNQDEFIAKIQEHKGMINKILYLYADSLEERKDLRQEILAAAWKAYPKFENRAKFSTWLYRIGLNVSFMRLRKKERTKSWDTEHNEVSIPQSGSLEGKELLAYIMGILQPLEKSIVMLLVEGYDQQEISEVLGISPGNTRVKIHRLRKKLKDYGVKEIA